MLRAVALFLLPLLFISGYLAYTNFDDPEYSRGTDVIRVNISMEVGPLTDERTGRQITSFELKNLSYTAEGRKEYVFLNQTRCEETCSISLPGKDLNYSFVLSAEEYEEKTVNLTEPPKKVKAGEERPGYAKYVARVKTSLKPR
jgi:hypothetical protein